MGAGSMQGSSGRHSLSKCSEIVIHMALLESLTLCLFMHTVAGQQLVSKPALPSSLSSRFDLASHFLFFNVCSSITSECCSPIYSTRGNPEPTG